MIDADDLRETLAEHLCDGMCHHDLGYRECEAKALALLPLIREREARAADEVRARVETVAAARGSWDGPNRIIVRLDDLRAALADPSGEQPESERVAR